MNKKLPCWSFCFVSAFIIIFGIGTLPALANYYIDSQGEIYFYELGQVLGKTDNRSAKSTPVQEVSTPSAVLVPSPITKKSQKIEIKTDRSQLKFQFVDQNNQTIASAESTASSALTIAEAEDANEVTLFSRNNASQIIRNRITAQTNFPLMVNLETNELMVTTPKGTKVVTILPDAAVAHMLAANVLDQAGGKGGLMWMATQITPVSREIVVTIIPTATSEADLAASAETTPAATPAATITPEPMVADITPIPTEAVMTSGGITLTETEDGILAYEIPGSKTKKLFGFIEVILDRVAIVSAETGELISVRQSPSAKILDIFSR